MLRYLVSFSTRKKGFRLGVYVEQSGHLGRFGLPLIDPVQSGRRLLNVGRSDRLIVSVIWLFEGRDFRRSAAQQLGEVGQFPGLSIPDPNAPLAPSQRRQPRNATLTGPRHAQSADKFLVLIRRR